MRRIVVAWAWLGALLSVNLCVVLLLSGSSVLDAPLAPFFLVWVAALVGVPLVLRLWNGRSGVSRDPGVS
jgi:hypothetical protein